MKRKDIQIKEHCLAVKQSTKVLCIRTCFIRAPVIRAVGTQPVWSSALSADCAYRYEKVEGHRQTWCEIIGHESCESASTVFWYTEGAAIFISP
jgi:hypothetical protein